MKRKILPTEDEVKKWLVSTLQHSCHVEYFLAKLHLGYSDPERPHDLEGIGNKFEWDVIKGFSLQYRKPREYYKKLMIPSLKLHTQQYHHRKWNKPNPIDKTKPIPGSSEEDMFVGAIDTICSLLENRAYQRGSHNYDQIIEIAKNNPPHKKEWMLRIIPNMKEIEQPSIIRIRSLDDFPNIGIKLIVYDGIFKRVKKVVQMLKREHNYFLN
tara:strand:- start:2562 stop:3197 length:636 start_codon:yes stop_codon:yes gene_type:complete